MNDAALVRVADGPADRFEKAEAVVQLCLRRMLAAHVLAHVVSERLPGDQLHREEVLAVLGAPGLVERGDVGMNQPGQRFGLAPEESQPQLIQVAATMDPHQLGLWVAHQIATHCEPALDADDTPCIAEVDRRRVERVLRNLVVNAVEHSEGRVVRVTVATDDDAVAVRVRDHGIGLSPAEAARVFDRFWRADPARGRATSGSRRCRRT